jgi:D-3-phosphoglycerate dehydrogenase
MPLADLTHVWVEAPFSSDALKELPEGVVQLGPESGDDPPERTAAPAQAIFASSRVRYDAALFERLPNLRIVTRTGIGVDNVNLHDATRFGIVVCNTPDGPTESTAEHTVAMLLALAKRLKQGNANMAAGKFGPRVGPLMGEEVLGKTLGLIGLGRIGRRVAEICRAGLGMEVVAYDPYVPEEQAETLGVVLAGLESVVTNADYLSLHVPVTPETRRVINHDRLAAMKTGSYLLNLARGPLVDHEALLEAVDSGKLAGAGLDVFDPEPPGVESRLRDHGSILVTPHTATATVDARRRIEEMAVDRVLAFFHDVRPRDVVNPAVLDLL